MTNFLYARIGTLVWGFAVSWLFTGELIVALPMFLTMALGNTLIMYLAIK